MCSHRHLTFHLFAKFRSSRTIGGGVMTSYDDDDEEYLECADYRYSVLEFAVNVNVMLLGAMNI